MYCKKCGTELPDTVEVCSKCGSSDLTEDIEEVDKSVSDGSGEACSDSEEADLEIRDEVAREFKPTEDRKFDYIGENTPVPYNSTLSYVLWGILSVISPLAGLMVYLVREKTRPKLAKVCGICALVSFLLSMIAAILFPAMFVGFYSSVFGNSSLMYP